MSQLNEREKYWISYYDSYVNGYNKTIGGAGSSFYSEENILLALKDYEAGKSLKEIEKIYHMNRTTLHKYRRVNNIQKRTITSHEIQSSINNFKKATQAR